MKNINEGIIGGAAKGGLEGTAAGGIGGAVVGGAAVGGIKGAFKEEEGSSKKKKKVKKKAGKPAAYKNVSENNIVEFIRSITEKKYSDADKYLQHEIDNRVRSRILKCLNNHE